MRKIQWFRPLALLCLTCSLLFTLAGCGSKESKWMGTYVNAKEPGFEVDIKADHKATLRDPSGPTEVTWELSGDDKLIVHGQMGNFEFLRNSDGTLRESMTQSDWKKK